MPWCPKCKNEYVEGVKTCTDCGCELIDSLDELEKEGLIFGSEEEMEELLAFFSCNGLKSGEIRFDETEDLYELFIASEEKVRASRYLQVFQKEKNLKERKEKAGEEGVQLSGRKRRRLKRKLFWMWKKKKKRKPLYRNRFTKRLPRRRKISVRERIPFLWRELPE